MEEVSSALIFKLTIFASSRLIDIFLTRAESNIADYFCQGGWQETVRMSDLLALHSSRYPALGRGATDFLFSHAQSPLVSLPQSQETNITRGFVIAKPRRRDSKSNRRVCLIYLIVNNSDNNSNNNTHHNSSSVSYWWSVAKTECQRNILPGM